MMNANPTTIAPAHSLAELFGQIIATGAIKDETLLNRIELAAASCSMPDPVMGAVDATLLAGEMQAVIQNAWNRWDHLDQEDAPALGDKLEMYACLNLQALVEAQARGQAAARVERDRIEQVVERAHAGVVVSAWSEQDLDFLFEDDDLAHLSESEISAHMPMIFERLSCGLKDILSERGNEHLACKWGLEKESILADLRKVAASA